MLRLISHSAKHFTRRQFHACPLVLDIVAIEVPSMGESVSSGEVVSISEQGDFVDADSVVAVIEQDKASF